LPRGWRLGSACVTNLGNTSLDLDVLAQEVSVDAELAVEITSRTTRPRAGARPASTRCSTAWAA
jgi:hypothetical protein